METDSVSPLAAVAILVKLILVPYLIHALPSGLVARRIGWPFSRGFLLAIAPTLFPFVLAVIMMTFPELYDVKFLGIEKKGMVLFALGSLLILILVFQMILLQSNLHAYVDTSDTLAILLAAALSFPLVSPALSILWLVMSFGRPHLLGVRIKTPSEPTSLLKNLFLIAAYIALISFFALASFFDLFGQAFTALIVLSALYWLWRYFWK
jgi:hypothetical protein